MGFGAYGQVEQEQQAAGAMREAVSWILSASSADQPCPRLHPLPGPGSCLDDSSHSPHELRPQQQPQEPLDAPEPPPQEPQSWVGVDIGGTLCKVVRWEIGSSHAGAAPEDAGGTRSATDTTTGKGTGSKAHLLVGAPARLSVHSHAPIPTLCSLCHLGAQCLEEAASGTSAASKTSSSTSFSSSTCSASLWASSGLAPLGRSCSSGARGEACTCSLTSGTLRFTRFETWRVPEFLAVLAEEHASMAAKHGNATGTLSPGLQASPKISIGITGGGARRFDQEFRNLSWIDVKRADELSSLVRGIDLLARVAPQDCFEYPGVTALRGGVIQRPYRSPSDPPSSPCSSSSAASSQGEPEGDAEGEGEGEGEPAFLGVGGAAELEPATELTLPVVRGGPAGVAGGVAVLGARLGGVLGIRGGQGEEGRTGVGEEEGEKGPVCATEREGTWRAADAPMGEAVGRQAACEEDAPACAVGSERHATLVAEEGGAEGEAARKHGEDGAEAGAEEGEQEQEEEEDGDEEVSAGLQYPYLVVNIGSGVSVLRVDAPGEFERVGGSSLGGSTFLGLTMALTGCATFREALALASKGDSSHVDMLVGDIYGGDYTQMGLKATTVASSFGKLVHARPSLSAKGGAQPDGALPSAPGAGAGAALGGGGGEEAGGEGSVGGAPGVEQRHLAKAALLMITNNVGSLAMLHARPAGVRHILFSGSFLHGNKLAMRSLAAAVDFWSKGAMRALFLRHEGHAGALGAMLACMPLGS